MPNQHEKWTPPSDFDETSTLRVVPHDLLAQTEVWLLKLCGFYFTALGNQDFSCIFAAPDRTEQAGTSFLLHLHSVCSL